MEFGEGEIGEGREDAAGAGGTRRWSWLKMLRWLKRTPIRYWKR
jgi:hypothetical protein